MVKQMDQDKLKVYEDGIYLIVANKREWSYSFKPDNKTVPLPCYLESPYDHQRESSASQTLPASSSAGLSKISTNSGF